MREEPLASHEPLTGRELEILRLIADGLSNQQVADRLFLTLETIKWYNKQTFQKLGVASRTQAVARAREWGLLAETAAAKSNNLPQPSTAFIGRKSELATIRTRLADPACRLLSLIGPGGIGKTRLAIEVARQLAADFPDGVYFVPLASIGSPTVISQTLADTLNLAQLSQQDPLAQVISVLRDKAVLLVIDNFEHLLDGTDLLGELLTKCRQSKILVTSRQRLRLAQEWLFDVPGLQCAAADSAPPTVGDLSESEATRLFMQTAERVRAGFAPDTEEAYEVVHICQLVGGMPLGIELSAAWVRVLPPGEIARQIEQGLDILRTTWRDVPERHQSLRAVLDQSWKLLSMSERHAFAQMSVFSGSFTRHAAEEIAQATPATLIELVDKSFLQRAAGDRFVIHELLKQYGADQLRNDGDFLPAQAQHCRYYADLLRRLVRSREGNPEADEIDQEFDEILTAWRNAVAHKWPDEIHTLAVGLRIYYSFRSWYRAGADAVGLYRQAAQGFDPATVDLAQRETLACLYESQGHLYELARANDSAMEAYEDALEYAEASDLITRGRLTAKLGDVMIALVQHAQAEATYARAEAILSQAAVRTVGWWFEWIEIQIKRLELCYWANRVEDMAALALSMRPIMAEHSRPAHRARYAYMLGLMAIRRDRYFNSNEANTYAAQALALSRQSDDESSVSACEFQYGFCQLWSGNLDEAEEHLGIANELAKKNGDLTIQARALTYLAVVYRKRGDLQGVRAYADASLKVATETNMPQYVGTARAQYAWLAWRAGDIALTTYHGQAATEAWAELGVGQSVVVTRWLALLPLLGVALLQEDVAAAVRWSQDLLPSPQCRLPDDLTRSLEAGISAWQEGSPERARLALDQAFRRAQELGYV